MIFLAMMAGTSIGLAMGADSEDVPIGAASLRGKRVMLLFRATDAHDKMPRFAVSEPSFLTDLVLAVPTLEDLYYLRQWSQTLQDLGPEANWLALRNPIYLMALNPSGAGPAWKSFKSLAGVVDPVEVHKKLAMLVSASDLEVDLMDRDDALLRLTLLDAPEIKTPVFIRSRGAGFSWFTAERDNDIEGLGVLELQSLIDAVESGKVQLV